MTDGPMTLKDLERFFASLLLDENIGEDGLIDLIGRLSENIAAMENLRAAAAAAATKLGRIHREAGHA